MTYATSRPWLFGALFVASVAWGCSPGSLGGAATDGAASNRDGDEGESDASVPFESGTGSELPDDDWEPGCTPKTCAELGVDCGPIDDGCGQLIDCGGCPEGYACGVEAPNRCGVGTCVPKTCADLGYECG